MKNPFTMDDLESREADSVVRGLAGGVKIKYASLVDVQLKRHYWYSRMDQIDQAAQSVADKDAVLITCQAFLDQKIAGAIDYCSAGFVLYAQEAGPVRPGFENRRIKENIIVCPKCGYAKTTPHV